MNACRVPAIELVQLAPVTIAALAAGDLSAANASSPVPLAPWFALEQESVRVWGYREAQLRERPSDADWITRVIWDPSVATAVGQAGFHGPPDERGMVEIGYVVRPEWRRRGYARAAFEAWLRRAHDEPDVHVLRATISPGNTASERLVASYGLVEVGQQWDDEDGLEIVYERPV